jgi:hypothetical protein
MQKPQAAFSNVLRKMTEVMWLRQVSERIGGDKPDK